MRPAHQESVGRGTGILPVIGAPEVRNRAQPVIPRTRHGQDARATGTRLNRALRLLIFPFLTLSGCAAYTTAQLHLTEQARKGVAIWTARESARDDTVRQSYAAKRKALDAAFDADVRARAPLDPEWVIESRRAYATALSQLDQSESTELANNESARRDAAATDDALARLAWLLQIHADAQSSITNVFTAPKGGTK